MKRGEVDAADRHRVEKGSRRRPPRAPARRRGSSGTQAGLHAHPARADADHRRRSPQSGSSGTVRPGSRPSSTARVIAAGAEAVAHVVERGVERAAVVARRTAARAARRRRRRGCATATPTSVRPRRSISGIAAASSPRAVGEDRLRLRGRARQRVRAGRAREVVEAQPQHDGAADAAGGAHAARDAVDEPDERRVDLVGRCAARRPSARCDADRAAPPAAPAPAAGRGCARARAGAGPTPRPSIDDERRPRRARATSPTVVIPRACSLRGGDRRRRPRAARPGAGAGTRARRSGGTTSRPSGLATPLATLARNFVRATPTVIGRPTRSRTVAPQPRRDLGRRARDAARSPRTSRNASSIESPSTSGVVSSNTRTPPCSPRSRPTCAAARRSPAGTGGARCRPPIAVRTPYAFAS